MIQKRTYATRSMFFRAGQALVALLALTEPAAAQSSGSFVSAGSMTASRWLHTATLLNDGRVLIAGGSSVGSPDYDPLSAELYDPQTGTFKPTGPMGTARLGHTATLLQNGKVLIAGGESNYAWRSRAELFDPLSGTFTPTGSMLRSHAGATATLLPDGKVLIAGGWHEPYFEGVWAAPEIYDPVTGKFSSAGESVGMNDGWTATGATILPDGRVLLTGLNPAEVYDPAAGVFHRTARMLSDAYQNGMTGHSAASLRNGEVLIAGGNPETGGCPTDRAEVYDPRTNAFRLVESSASQRSRHTATTLSTGSVLIVGGRDCTEALASAELFRPDAEVFVPAGALLEARSYHTATTLQDGSVLIAGGQKNGRTLRSAERYVPMTSPPPAGSCVSDPFTACLFDRFAVKVRYRRGFDNTAPDSLASAKTVGGFESVQYQTAFFYFNSPNNVEVLVKMLDQGNASNGVPTVAVITGVATPLRVEVVVTDTRPGGGTQVYSSSFGSQQGVTDFTAFPR